MVGKKYVKTILMVAVLLMASILPTLATSNREGTSTGAFTIKNVPPYKPTITLYYANRTKETTTMTPQMEFALKIETGDPNGLDDIKSIIVYIFYASNANDERNRTDDPKDPQVQATYKWEKGEGWKFIGPDNSTWNISTNSTNPSDGIGIATVYGTWWLHFIPSKVATETENGGMWIIKVVVYDQSDAKSWDKITDIMMNWYGEIEVLNRSFYFGIVKYGDTNKPIMRPIDRNIDVKTISNGNHKIEAKTDSTWKHQDQNYWVRVNTTGPPSDGEISLKHNAYDNVLKAKTVKTSYEPIPGLTNLQQTTENGTISQIYIWLDVGPSGIIPGTYTGNYYVQINNIRR